MFLSLPVMNEKGQFLISRIYRSNEHYTILCDSIMRSFVCSSVEEQILNFLKKRINLLAEQIIYIGSSNYGKIVLLMYLAYCPFNSANVKSSSQDEELRWVSLKEMPTLIQKEELFVVDILQKFCLQTDFGLQALSKSVN